MMFKIVKCDLSFSSISYRAYVCVYAITACAKSAPNAQATVPFRIVCVSVFVNQIANWIAIEQGMNVFECIRCVHLCGCWRPCLNRRRSNPFHELNHLSSGDKWMNTIELKRTGIWSENRTHGTPPHYIGCLIANINFFPHFDCTNYW